MTLIEKITNGYIDKDSIIVKDDNEKIIPKENYDIVEENGKLILKFKEDIYILGIESSCDDTSAAVLRNDVLLSNVTASQDVHKAYGGVVPELASRAHQQNVVPVVDQAIKRAGIAKEQLNAVAFTRVCFWPLRLILRC